MRLTDYSGVEREEFRDRVATIQKDGKRKWIYPKKPKGRYYNWRTIVSVILLAVLFGLPFIKYNGEPFVLLNVLERKFIIFGSVFTPQDTHLLALAMLALVIFIVLFTVVFGRLFCGWVCPQTIFMEMVFRKIEYWIEGDYKAQERLDKAPWTADKYFKKGLKHAIFFTISVLIANTFLAYIIGIDEVVDIATDPVSMHVGGFAAMIIFSFLFYLVFSQLREQVCIAICPYGRLQGVMLGQDSIVVAYDFERGEPRGKIRKQKKHPRKQNPVEAIQSSIEEDPTRAQASMAEAAVAERSLGDCIDCKLCVHVCPTGIDIRNGTQLECVNCTACIDACDEVMDKIGRPRGLIRYDSYNGIVEKKRSLFTPRVAAYSVVLLLLIGVEAFLIGTRTDVETIILRTPGMLYQEVDENYISNLYNYQVINKTSDVIEDIEFKLVDANGRIRTVGDVQDAEKQAMSEGAFFIDMEKSALENRKTPVRVEIYSNGELIDRAKTNFLGPVK